MMFAAYRIVLMDSQEEEAILTPRPFCGSTLLFVGAFWVPAVCSAPSQGLGNEVERKHWFCLKET